MYVLRSVNKYFKYLSNKKFLSYVDVNYRNNWKLNTLTEQLVQVIWTCVWNFQLSCLKNFLEVLQLLFWVGCHIKENKICPD